MAICIEREDDLLIKVHYQHIMGGNNVWVLTYRSIIRRFNKTNFDFRSECAICDGEYDDIDCVFHSNFKL